MIKVKTFGWRNKVLGQLDRIELGFKMDGIDVVQGDDFCDFIYCHDSSEYDLAIEYKNKYPSSVLMLKVLDIPWHINDFSPNNLINKLKCADIILANSITVQRDIYNVLGFESVVVYDSMQPTRAFPSSEIENNIKEIDFFMVGRLMDKNKRFDLFLETLRLFKEEKKESVIVGPEGQNIILKDGEKALNSVNYLNVVSLEILNQLYNLSKFTLCLGKNEGVCLPMIESMKAGSIPIVCRDMATAWEFCPIEFTCEPKPESVFSKILELEKNYDFYRILAISHGENLYFKYFNENSVVKRIFNAYLNYQKDRA